MFRSGARLFVTSLLVASLSAIAGAQSVRSRVTTPVSNAQLTKLHSGVHPLARPEFDKGEVDDATPANRMMLVLQRSPEQETDLRTLLEQQQETSSTLFHQWETPESFGRKFGPSDSDIAALTTWLSASGFTGVKVNSSRTVVEFSGTAGTLKSAFHTSLHHYLVNGQTYTANSVDPQVPAALAPVVAGFSSLNNFPRKALHHDAGIFRRDKTTGKMSKVDASGQPVVRKPSPNFTYPIDPFGDDAYGITPYDFATIYNVSALWNASTPIDGTGQTIAIVGRTDINPVDFVNFRKIFGLPVGANNSATGSSYLNIIYNGPNPGINGDEIEADIDTQWSSAVAKGATIDYVTSSDSYTTFGVDLSAQYVIDNNLAPVMSESYGACELGLGNAGNQFYAQLWEQASAQGITAMVSTGDSGNAVCDDGSGAPAIYGPSVSGIASTPYNVAVGGTDWDLVSSTLLNNAFSASNSSNGASAKAYIPEIPWNNSCANPVFSLAYIASEYGLNTTGASAEKVCNTSGTISLENEGYIQTGVGGSGGPSNCVVADGTYKPSGCQSGYAKPSWQSVTGVPTDGVRDSPDVSLFAANGEIFSSFYLLCNQDSSADGTCNLNSPYEDFAGEGGTSVASPAFAGIMSLVNEKNGRQGNANYVLYKLFAAQAAAGTSCASSSTSTPNSACTFNDITTGSIAQPCQVGYTDCTAATSGDQVAVLPGGAATVGYDTATGLGSVNAANLVNNWAGIAQTVTTTTLTLSSATIVHGAVTTASATVKASSGTPTGDVTFNGAWANGSSAPFATLASGTATESISSFPGGTYSVVAHYGGSATYAESDSAPVTVTITPEASTLTVTPQAINQYTGTISALPTSSPYGTVDYVLFGVAGASGKGYATGTIVVKDNGAAFDGGVILLSSTGTYQDYSPSLTPGTHALTASYAGDSSFKASTASSASFTITKAPTTEVASASAASVSANGTVTFYATLNTTSFGYYSPSGVVTFMAGSKTLGTATLYQSYDPSTDHDLSTADLVIPANTLATGSNTITAVYAGDSNYGAPTTTASVNVTVTAPTLPTSITTATVSPAIYTNVGNLTFGATVAPSTATGTVELFIDGNDYGSFALSGGLVSVSGTIGVVAAGQHSVFWVYSGSTKYQASTSAIVYFTVPATAGATASTTAIALSTTTVVPGGTATAMATVTTGATGTVQLVLDGNVYGGTTALTVGASTTATVSLPTASLGIGLHTVAFLYDGNPTYAQSTSPTVTLTIAPLATTATTTSVSLSPASVEQTSTTVATVTVVSGSATGSVQLQVDGLNVGSLVALSGGTALITVPASVTAALSVGTHTVTAAYYGSTSYGPSQGAAFLTVTPGPTFTLTPATTTATVTAPGQAASVTLTAAPSNGFTGSVVFTCACTNLPTGVSYAFLPTAVSISGTTAQTTVLTFTTTAPSSSDGLAPHAVLIIGGGPIALACLGLLFIPRRKRVRFAALLGMVVLLMGAVSMSGCSSSSSAAVGTTHTPSGGTALGTYGPITITATSGIITQTAQVTLVVN